MIGKFSCHVDNSIPSVYSPLFTVFGMWKLEWWATKCD